MIKLKLMAAVSVALMLTACSEDIPVDDGEIRLAFRNHKVADEAHAKELNDSDTKDFASMSIEPQAKSLCIGVLPTGEKISYLSALKAEENYNQRYVLTDHGRLDTAKFVSIQCR